MFLSELFESASDIVYHITKTNNAINILEKKRFNFSPAIGSSSEQDMSDKLYYFSLARSKNSVYIQKNITNSSAIFVLNGRYINYNHKVKPVNYWGKKTPEYNEMEDRIMSDNPYMEIPDTATDLISEVHVFGGRKDKPNDRWYNAYDFAIKIFSLCKKMGIPVYVYNDETAMARLDKSKALSLAEIKAIRDQAPPREKPYPRQTSNRIDRWMELSKVDDFDKLSPKTRSLVWNLVGRSSIYIQDAISGLASDIHNSKFTHHEHPEMSKLLGEFRRVKAKSVKEFVKFISDKWTKIMDDRDGR